MESQLEETIGLNQIAFFTGYSDWHFHRLFKSIQVSVLVHPLQFCLNTYFT
ncbi:hypothetical protein LEP1GSC203_0531 [Leptospira terpstrae serovar Hualin str. LT 11-33 = ATCC 700639]|uniref:Uncharacterized protein n=2 Tax=Leptospira TaxID=171 RepID=N1VU06_9LEPT|nr:hypothetical protein LEP1GSC203_0531 [Leptospira terpstrae serovar Hualin str. LT 11-33 = ATCC 700639]